MRKLAIGVAACLVCGTAATARALWLGALFAPKKLQASCYLLTEHPGSGGIPTTLKPRVLDAKGAATLTAKVDLKAGLKTLMKGVNVTIAITTDAKGVRTMAATFANAARKVFYRGRSMMNPKYWATVTWQNWPESQAYLEARGIIERAP